MLNLAALMNLTANDVESPNLFPFPLKIHVVFCVVAFIFFVLRFSSTKKPYQAIMAITIPLSLTIWLSTNRTWFYTIGIMEVLLILAAWITTFFDKDKKKKDEEKESSSDDAEDDDDEGNAPETDTDDDGETEEEADEDSETKEETDEDEDIE